MTRLSDTVKIVIHPSGAEMDTLTVSDAMQQVLDVFELLSRAEAKDPQQKINVVWRLERATTNSPLTVEAAPLSSNPEVPIGRQAIQAALALGEGLSLVLKAESKASWIDESTEAILVRVLKRNSNGIGRTDLFLLQKEPPTTIDHKSARRGQNFLERLAAEEASRIEDLTRKEYGSVEGHVSGATTWYGKPAFTIRARLSGKELKCVLAQNAAAAVGAEHNWDEVWSGRRVLVSGVCYYDSAGQLTRIEAENVQKITTRDVGIAELRDPSFSNGMSPSDHLLLTWGDERD